MLDGLEDEFDQLGDQDLMDELEKYDLDDGTKNTNTNTNKESDDTDLDKMMAEIMG